MSLPQPGEPASRRKALALFRRHHGLMRTRDILAAGVHPAVLYALRDDDLIRPLARGLYGLADMPPLTHPDMVAVSQRVPRAVICLVSALAFHELTAEIPHAVDIALPRGSLKPRLDFPPIRVHWFSKSAYAEGVETHMADQFPLRVYNPEKTLADCFQRRNRIGLDTVLDALRRYKARPDADFDRILKFARLNRVEQRMRPYLEALQ